MKKVWVLGSQGLVASQLCLLLRDKGIDFVASSHTQVDALNQAELELFFDQHKPTHIINGVAHVKVDAAQEEQKELCYALNSTVVEYLALLCKIKGCKLIHISTDYVFDGKKSTPYEVDDPVNPINVYGKSKLEGEQKLFTILPHACCIRTASVYGLTKPGLISGILHALETKQEVVNIIDQISTPTNAKDLSRAIIDMLDQEGLYQFVNEGSSSRYDLTVDVFNYCRKYDMPLACTSLKKVTQAQSKRLATRPTNSVLSNQKIRPLLTFTIRTYRQALYEYLLEARGMITQ